MRSGTHTLLARVPAIRQGQRAAEPPRAEFDCRLYGFPRKTSNTHPTALLATA